MEVGREGVKKERKEEWRDGVKEKYLFTNLVSEVER